ncbi:MAG: hypothetical protein IJ496_00435, partial [Ruminococcus sp.]|nr:hypothetical protein [Ruminococcus sp.]
MKLRKLMAALTAAATALSGLPPAVHFPHVHAEESHSHEAEAPSGIYEDTGAPTRLTRIESEPSEFGLTEVTYLDENGNPVEFDLVPEGLDRATELPEKYDLREEGLVTPAKSQSPTNTCWAHGAMAVAESNLIKKGYADTSLDLSEAHLVYFARCYSSQDESDVLYGDGYSDGYLGYQANESAGEEDGYSSGGNPLNIQSAFSHWSGPVIQPSTEKIADFPSFDESRRYDHDYIMVNSEEISRDDPESIKQMLMKNGALTISYHTGGDAIYTSYYNRETKGQYGYDLTGTNHAVTLVGWDDTYSKDNFLTPAPEDGAWICKNSWGTTFGEDGYFYLSYCDPTFTRIYTLDMEENSTYDNRYQVYGIEWNPLRYSSGYTLLNTFTADSFETLTAASFYTSNASVPYKIYVTLDDEDGAPMSGELVYTQAGTADYSGYHTVNLNQTIPLKPGQKFTVAVTLDDSSGIFYLDMTANTEGVSYFAGTTNPSSSTNWYAAGKNTSYLGEVCVSAFTEDNIKINAATFPDAKFRSYVSSSLDANKDGELSEAEIAGITSISVSGKGISDLTGIEYFTYLTNLYCGSNQLKYVNLENNTRLTTLSCAGNTYSAGRVPCTGFTVDGLDMSRVTAVSGATISGEMFVPTAGVSYITYQYACSSSQTATFKVSFTQTHAQVGSNGKCVNCGVQVYYAKAVSESGTVSYFTWLDKAITYAEEADEPVTITLLAGMAGGFTVTAGDITFDSGGCSIVSWDENPAILVSGGSVAFTNSVLYNMSTGSALKVTGGTVSIQGGYYEEGKDETGIGLEVTGGTVTITGGNFRKYGTDGTAIKSSVPISDLLPDGYVFYTNGSTTEIAAEGYINPDETEVKTLSVSVTAGAHTSHEYNSGTTAGSSEHTAVCDQCGLTESQAHTFGAWTDTDDTNHSKTCSICGQKLSGTHTYGAWSVTDPDQHVKTCTVCGHEEEGAHTFSAWTNAGEDGCTRTCSVCGRVETQGHDLTLWFDMEDGENHARICTACPYYEEAAHTPGECSDNGDDSHSSFCTVCDAEFKEDHSFGDWSDNGDGTHTQTCSDCGAENTANCSFTEYEQDYDKITTHKELCPDCGASRDAAHVYTEWEDAEDDTYHVRICLECLWVDIQTHTLGNWSDNGDGTHTAGCTECTYSETHDHGFGDWTESDEELHIRTCTDCGAEETD